MASGSLRSVIFGGDVNRTYGKFSSILCGRFGESTLYGEMCHATQPLSSQNRGGIQHSMLLASARTGSTSTTELFLDGTSASERIVLPAKTAWHFDIKIVAYQ